MTLDAVHKHIGNTVTVHGDTGTRKYLIVGRIVLPSVSSDELQPMADAASFTSAGLRPILEPEANQTHILLVKEAPGADHAAVMHRLEAIKFAQNTNGPTTPVEISRLEKIGWFPPTLAAVLAVLALLAVGHTLVTSVRRRRRELALFKTIGFSRRQVTRDHRVAGDDARDRRDRHRVAHRGRSSATRCGNSSRTASASSPVINDPDARSDRDGDRRARTRQRHRVLPRAQPPRDPCLQSRCAPNS